MHPLGRLEVDPNIVGVGLGLADPAGLFSVTIAVPNSPTAINTYAFQALAGDLFRLFLSSSAQLTVQ